MTGLGFEVSFEIGEFSPRKAPKDTSLKRTRDTVEVQEKQPDGSVVIYKPRSSDQETDLDYRWLGELAIGYTELRDFESATPGLAILGVVRELPSVSLYFNHQSAEKDTSEAPSKTVSDKGLGWYMGVRTGLAELQGFRGYVGTPGDGTPDQIYNGGGTTFQFGILAGAIYDFGFWNLFLEAGYTRRRFSSVEWEGIDGTAADVLPRSLDMSTLGVSLGTQIAIGSGSKK